jgi:hypothetical protein
MATFSTGPVWPESARDDDASKTMLIAPRDRERHAAPDSSYEVLIRKGLETGSNLRFEPWPLWLLGIPPTPRPPREPPFEPMRALSFFDPIEHQAQLAGLAAVGTTGFIVIAETKATVGVAFSDPLSIQLIERLSVVIVLWSVSFVIAMRWYARRKARRASRAAG